MGRRVWKQLFFLGTAVLTALMFWNLERKSKIVTVNEGTVLQDTEAKTETRALLETEQLYTAPKDEIRVLIRSDEFQSEYQETLVVRCLTPAFLEKDGEKTELEAGSELSFTPDTGKKEKAAVSLSGQKGEGSFSITGLKRGYEEPVYSGTLEILNTSKGYVVINELPLEEYLKKVVPSEMPSSYPLEALKAQAVCARTYAMKRMEKPGLPEWGADVDDSVEFQVYNNQPETAAAAQAVEETKGMVLMDEGVLVDALYYSTSCGVDFTRDLSKETVFCAFLSMKNKEDHEWEEPWYRWNTYFSLEELTSLSRESGFDDIGAVRSLSLGDREKSGCLSSLTIEGSEGTKVISGEYHIRKFLKPSKESLMLQNGEKAPDIGMLPSAFFYLTPSYDGTTLLGYQMTGGGYGHGRGLSQNGARNMAEKGMGFQEILTYYYGELELNEVLDTRD